MRSASWITAFRYGIFVASLYCTGWVSVPSSNAALISLVSFDIFSGLFIRKKKIERRAPEVLSEPAILR